MSQTFDKLITTSCTEPTFIPRRHSLRALRAFYVKSWLYPFAMATPSMRRIFLQAFQRVLKSFFPFLGLGSRWPRQVNPLSVFKCENNAKNARMKRSTGGMETGASAIGKVRHFHLCFKLVIYLMDVRIAVSSTISPPDLGRECVFRSVCMGNPTKYSYFPLGKARSSMTENANSRRAINCTNL